MYKSMATSSCTCSSIRLTKVSGIGSRLLAIGQALISEAGHTDAELHTRVDNVRAIALYRSVGWQLTDRLIHSAHDGIEYDEQVLVKHLDR